MRVPTASSPNERTALQSEARLRAGAIQAASKLRSTAARHLADYFVALAFVALVVGCGGGGSSVAASVTTTSLPVAAAPAAQRPTVDLAEFSRAVQQMNEDLFGIFDVTLGKTTMQNAQLLCVDFAAKNIGQKEHNVQGVNEFVAIDPAGEVLRPSPYDGKPFSTTVIPGATTLFNLCFPTNGQHGDFRIEYRPMSRAPATAQSWTVNA